MGKAVSSDVTFGFLGGLVTFQVDLVPLRVTADEVKTELVCAECEDPTKISQQYVCPTDATHGPFTIGTAHRAMRLSKTELKKVSPEQIAEAKAATLPPGEATFHVFPAAEVESATLPNGVSYRVKPRKQNQPIVAALVDVVNDPSLAFLAEITVRQVQRLFRCVVRDNNLVLTELVRPGEFTEPEAYPTEYPVELLQVLTDNVKQTIEAFEADQFVNFYRDRAEALRTALADPNAPAPDLAAPVIDRQAADTDALIALLKNNLTPAPKKKAPAKVKA